MTTSSSTIPDTTAPKPQTSLSGANVVITGGSKGIGLGIAQVFAASGANILLAGRSTARLVNAAERLRPLGDGLVKTATTDVSQPTECAQLADDATSALGGVDVLCCNAGIFPSARLNSMTAADLDGVMRVNLYGTIFCVQAFTEALTASGRGRVVITSSITGPVTGYPGWAHYAASKAAQLGFLRTAAIELAPAGITVNAVLPGNVKTEGLTEMGSEYLNTMAAAVPLGRLGTPTDIGYAVAFLASEQAGYITGQTLIVDGGQILPESPEAMTEVRDA